LTSTSALASGASITATLPDTAMSRLWLIPWALAVNVSTPATLPVTANFAWPALPVTLLPATIGTIALPLFDSSTTGVLPTGIPAEFLSAAIKVELPPNEIEVAPLRVRELPSPAPTRLPKSFRRSP